MQHIGRILITNDDGYDAPGLQAARHIAEALSDDVWVMAPKSQKSGASHSISFSTPVQFLEIEPKLYVVDGTPADCVLFATRHFLKHNPPDLIISGVNWGQNIAEDINYSGTVAGAREGALAGIRSLALSQALDFEMWQPDFQIARTYAPKLIRALLATSWQAHTPININFPPNFSEHIDVKFTRQGMREKKLLTIDERTDTRGNPYFWYGFNRHISDAAKDTDLAALIENVISVTPLSLDYTDMDMRHALQGMWDM